MKSGALGIAIIFIAFLGTSFIYSIEPTETTEEKLNYKVTNDELLKNKEFTPKYQEYVIPLENPKHYLNKGQRLPYSIVIYDKLKFFSYEEIDIWCEMTPLKTILDSLEYSKNCELITIDFNLKTESWKTHNAQYSYPSTPLLCSYYPITKEYIPFGLNHPGKFQSKEIIGNTIINYHPGETSIYINSCDKNGAYQATGGAYFPISKLYIAHHYNTVHYNANIFMNDHLTLNESEYKIKWHENNNNLFSNPIINIKDKHPENGHSKVTLSNFTNYGNEVTINGQTFPVINSKIILDKKPYSIQNIDVYYDNNTCLLKLNNDNVTKDLGKIKNYIISGRGDWGFTPQFYEGKITQNVIQKIDMNPFNISQMDGGAIALFIIIVVISSVICSYSIGLYFTDWAVILATIALLLIV